MKNQFKGYRDKKVLITGGLGLIGSNLAHELVKLEADVTITDSMLPLYGGNLFNIKGIEEKIKLHYADIRDVGAMNQLVKGKDIIFNLAAQVSYTDSLDNPFLDLDINCSGHLTVLEACRKYNPTVKIIFSGSRMQFGKIENNPVNEDHDMNPLSIYGIHKLTAEKYYIMYNKMYGIKVVIFRIANPYGPRHQMKHSKYGMVNWFIRLAMENKTIKIFGDGQQIRDYIYVDDIVSAFLAAGINEEANGEVFNLGSGEPKAFLEMAQCVIDVVKKGRIKLVPWPDDYFNIETGGYVTDISKIKNTLMWTPKVMLEEGIEKTFNYYLNNKIHYWS